MTGNTVEYSGVFPCSCAVGTIKPSTLSAQQMHPDAPGSCYDSTATGFGVSRTNLPGTCCTCGKKLKTKDRIHVPQQVPP